MLEINDTIIVEVRRDNAPPAPPVPYTTPLAGIGGDFTASKPLLKRQFFINNSDYSDYVMEWPSLTTKWNDARPRDLKIQLVNKEHRLNYFFSDRPQLNSSCHLNIGYENITAIELTSGSQLEHYTASIVAQGPKTICFHTAIDSGTYGDQAKTFWRSANTNADSGYLEIYKNSSNYLGFEYIAPGGSTTTLEVSPSSYSFYPGRYYHVTAEISSSHLALWKDAILVNSVASTNNIVWSMTNPWYGYVGGKDTEGNFRIADLRIYSELLTYAEINNVRYGAGHLINPQPENHHKFQLNLLDDIHNYKANKIGDVTFAYGPNLYPTMQTIFRGRLDGLTYDEGRVTIDIIDALHPLNETTVGAPNSPEYFTNALPSDIAHDVITDYAGLHETWNVDSESFYKWAEVFSVNNILMDATFTGERPTEVLRTLAEMTQSAIYTEHGSLTSYVKFNLFNELGSATLELNQSTTLDSKTRLNADGVINYQYIAADYDESSNYHRTEVLARDTVSYGHYGLREDKQKSTTIWFVGSISAMYFANRSIAMNKDPRTSFEITTGLMGLSTNVSDTIIIKDKILDPYGGNVSGGYRVLGRTIDLDKGTVKFEASEAGALFTSATPFRLDYSELDGTHVLL